MRERLGVLVVVSLLCGMVFSGAVEAAEPTAQQILDSVSDSTAFAGSGEARVDMTVTSRRGQVKTQQVDLYRSDDGRGTTKQLVVFVAPADVKGTKFLSISSPRQSTQMWLYLPAVGRERVIAGSAVQGKFMGTDFTFEEISGASSFSEEYKPVRQRDKSIDGRDCYVLELAPKSTKASYGRLTMAVDKQSRIPLSVEFFDKRKRPIKRLDSKDLRRNSKGEWQPHEVTLADLNTGSTTVLRILSSSEKPVSEDVFTLRYLRR
ncbi:MAG: outer membrane lipoprotein-sorting protein [Limnochordia bacterium]